MAKKEAPEKKDEEKEEAAPAKEGAAEGKEGEAPAEGDAAAAPKKSKKKIIIIGALALLLVIGGVAGAYFAGLFGHAEEKTESKGVGPDGKAVEKHVFYTMPEFLVNLNTGTKQNSFLKMTVVLELANETDTPLIEANLPVLVDAVNTYLRELRASDLAGSAGIQRLREELLARANKVVSPLKVNDVLFKEIVVQ